MPHPTQLVSSLAAPERLSLYARIVSAGEEGVERAELRGARPAKRLARLLRDGLVREEGSRIVAMPEVFAEAMRAHKDETRSTDPVEALFHEGRLTSMPARQELRLAVLGRITDRLFAPELEYTEKQVNTAIRTCFDDPSALRRYLVEEGFLDREDDGSRYRLAQR
ncbi:DUF2087 domain-containing protein [Nocardiopsis exhalans]|uniref:DUF2087 domain-containing protein n=1 Tax=Nocardiopsis exhalans TaxID=163604 RepID=A0ABY5D8N0_9ACTN|nr:DUF2087 domain-containing protein [Nocardiopsis exhalans]USY19466.1 DUF2087 domain-containing protein [Nocardiopsis exhalans]